MTPSQDRIAKLRAELANLSGPARCPTLLMLGQALADRYWRTGPGRPANLPDLNDAIAALEEAYGYLEPRDQQRGVTANALGWTRGARHTLHGGDVADRDAAIRLLEESLSFTALPPLNATTGRLMLGQLYLMQALQGVQDMGMTMALLSGGADPAHKAAAGRAVEYLRQVVEAPPISVEIANAAQTMLAMAEAMRDLLDGMSGGPLGMDLSRLQKVLALLQQVQSQAARASGGSGYGRMAGFTPGGGGPFTPGGPYTSGGAPGQPVVPPLPLFEVSKIMTEPPLDRPVMVVDGSEPPAPTVAPKPPPAAVSADLKRLREALAERFAQLAAAFAKQAEAGPSAAAPAHAEQPDAATASADRADGSPEVYLSAAGLLRPDGPPLPDDAVDDCVALATTVIHEAEAADPAGAGLDRFLLAIALFLRARCDVDAAQDDGGRAAGDGWGDAGSADGDGWAGADTDHWGDSAAGDLAAGLDSLLRAAELLPPEHPAAAATLTAFAAFLDDRQPLRSLTDDVARRFADRADAVAAVHAGPESDLAVVRAVAAVCRSALAVHDRSFRDTAPTAGTAPTAATVEAVPDGYPWRFRLQAAAGAAALAEALALRDAAGLRSAGVRLAEAAANAPARYARTPGLRMLKRLAKVLGSLGGDAVALRAAVDDLADVSDARTAGTAEAIRLHALLGGLRLALVDTAAIDATGIDATAEMDGLGPADEASLRSAIESLHLAATQLTDDSDAVLRGDSRWRLAEAYRRLGTAEGREQSRLAALRALRSPGPRGAGARSFAGWMLDGGGAYEAFEALEVAALAEDERLDPLLRDVATVLLGPAAQADTPASDARTPPTVGEVAAALRTIEAAALVYLHPVPDRPHAVGILLLDATTERLDLLGTVVVPDVTADAPPVDWTDRAWAALVEPLLALTTAAGAGPRRVLVAATGALGRLPLGAIRAEAGGYAADDLVVSFVRSGRQVVELARRTPLPVTEDAVFVANPRGDREFATFEAMTLRRIFHPNSIGLGRTVEQVHGAGTPADVLAHLPGPAGPGAGLLHLGCALRSTGAPGLELADPGPADVCGVDPDTTSASGAGPVTVSGRAVLDVTRIAAQASDAPVRESGGLAILPADAGADHGRWVSFADVLQDAGLTGVIGWLWPVPEHIATLMQVVLHGKLVDEGLPPARAVHAVHRWMLDRERVAPPYLPAGLVAAVRGTDLADPRYWAALCHRGR